MWYVYILCSTIKKNYTYIGSTNDLNRRLSQHNSLEGELATKAYKPFTVESYIAVKEEKTARSLESYLKTGSGKAFLNKRILSLSAGLPAEAKPKIYTEAA